jgi:hypothetical protein
MTREDVREVAKTVAVGTPADVRGHLGPAIACGIALGQISRV